MALINSKLHTRAVFCIIIVMDESKTKSLYDFPEVYDQILCHDAETVDREVKTIVDLLGTHGITGGRILELACGTCVHSIALARARFECVGLDLSERMLECAKRTASTARVNIELHKEDIIDFDLRQEFDCVIFMSETFPLIAGHKDVKSHFAAVRRHLRDGGLYIIDIDSHKHGVGTKCEEWGRRTVKIEGGTVDIWNESFPGDWVIRNCPDDNALPDSFGCTDI